MVSFADDRKLKGSQSSKVTTTDKSLLSENSLLREQVERERFRRKVSFINSMFIHLHKEIIIRSLDQ